MTSVSESLTSQRTPMGADLKAGVDAISLNQTVVFTLYVKLVLPTDGFVFWVRADKVSKGALMNAAALNKVEYNQPPRLLSAAKTIVVQGSLHFGTDMSQQEDETIGINQVVFTSETEVQDLNAVGPAAMYVAEFKADDDGEPIRFAFSRRDSFYQQSDLWHYTGTAVYPDMLTQLVDDPVAFDTSVVVSDSLPFWLQINDYSPLQNIDAMQFRLFPSFLVPDNMTPPFGSVHILETSGLQAAPYLSQDGSHWQLVRDRVRVTTYGVRNDWFLDFLDCVNAFSLETDDFGLMNIPVPVDEKRTQPELRTIAQKKTIEFEVSYYQTRSRDVSRRLIEQAFINFTTQPPSPPVVPARFIGFIVADQLFVVDMESGTLAVGDAINGSDVAPGTVIESFIAGSGGVGNYLISPSQTVAATEMTATSS